MSDDVLYNIASVLIVTCAAFLMTFRMIKKKKSNNISEDIFSKIEADRAQHHFAPDTENARASDERAKREGAKRLNP